MSRLRNLAIAAGALLAGLTVASGAFAKSPCSISAVGTVTGTVNYDPFSAGGVGSASISMDVTRDDSHVTGMYFYFTTPTTTPSGMQITTTQTGTGVNTLFYGPAFPASPDLTAHTQAGGVIALFGNPSGSNTATITGNITIPAGTNFSAGPSIPLGIRYVCTGNGQDTDVTVPSNLTTALTVNVNVLSALQASYVGSALDFGSITTLTNATVLGAPATYTRSGQVRTASTAPYTVAVSSTNGYQMTAASSVTPINYELKFLGQSLSHLGATTLAGTTASFTTKTCQTASVSGVTPAISAVLLEGGSLKNTGAYSDTVTVTITPLVYTTAGGVACSS